ncbi:hypothetical protein CEK25_012166 [Fusarium fujikuroi]|nr:hypothetical protein CEK25_012166 [Fusarium fujikuroi]
MYCFYTSVSRLKLYVLPVHEFAADYVAEDEPNSRICAELQSSMSNHLPMLYLPNSRILLGPQNGCPSVSNHLLNAFVTKSQIYWDQTLNCPTRSTRFPFVMWEHQTRSNARAKCHVVLGKGTAVDDINIACFMH